jgi:hypothetical protein
VFAVRPFALLAVTGMPPSWAPSPRHNLPYSAAERRRSRGTPQEPMPQWGRAGTARDVLVPRDYRILSETCQPENLLPDFVPVKIRGSVIGASVAGPTYRALPMIGTSRTHSPPSGKEINSYPCPRQLVKRATR